MLIEIGKVLVSSPHCPLERTMLNLNCVQIWVKKFRGGIHPLGCNHLDLNVFARNPAVSAYCVEWNGLIVNSGKIVIWHLLD